VSESNGLPKKPPVPPWLAALGIGVGDYLAETKPRLKRGMKAQCFSPAARVFCCLTLHTLSYKQELAVKMEGGKRVPLTPTDVARETGMPLPNVRRAVLELEAWGLSKAEGLTKGTVRFYSWVIPREVNLKIIIARDNNSGVIPHLLSLYKRFKIRVPDGFIIARENENAIEVAAREWQTAEVVLKEALRSSLREASPNKKKETERNSETNEQTKGPRSAARAVRPSVSPEIRLKVKNWLEPQAARFGLYTLLDETALSLIAAEIPDEGAFERFKRQVLKQKPQADNWKYFASIAKATAPSPPTAPGEPKIPAPPPGFPEALRQRWGDGTLPSFRVITGDPYADEDQMNSAYEDLCAEFGISLKTISRGGA
jgi:hypothetical protein